MIWMMYPVAVSRWRYIAAEGPCWKGELQIGRMVLGWQITPPPSSSQEQP